MQRRISNRRNAKARCEVTDRERLEAILSHENAECRRAIEDDSLPIGVRSYAAMRVAEAAKRLMEHMKCKEQGAGK